MVSVCLATYNGAVYLREQVDSILPQLGNGDELVVSDDGSTDETLQILASYGDKRIKVFHNSKKHGCIHNFENALRHAMGDIIILSDQDDKWADNKVAVMSEALQSCDCVVSDAYVTDASMHTIYPSFYECNRHRSGKFYNLFMRNHYLGCCMAFKRCILRKALPFPSNIPMHDIWLGNVAAFYYRFKFIPNKLTYYRRHDNNASSTSTASKYGLIQQLKFRINIFFPLLGRGK